MEFVSNTHKRLYTLLDDTKMSMLNNDFALEAMKSKYSALRFTKGRPANLDADYTKSVKIIEAQQADLQLKLDIITKMITKEITLYEDSEND